MYVFANPQGAGSIWFENHTTPDGTPVVYDPQARVFIPGGTFCANRSSIGCNWLAPHVGALCRSCAMTTMAPDLSIPGATDLWAETEAAKRWALDNLGRWHWFRPEDMGARPEFHMLAEGLMPVQMGHSNGLVTISVAEADPVVRTRRREALDEPFRTMLGHMRHELAHMVWWRLSIREDFLKEFRSIFGDERADYSEALENYYNAGPPSDWSQWHLTSYASAHPHEDWAETASHLLHLTDIADSFVAAGLSSSELPHAHWDPYAEPDSDLLIHVAVNLIMGLNHVNRSMGLADLYPFILSPVAHRKLVFAHHWLRKGAMGY